MKSFLEFLNESVIDPKNKTLDPMIFDLSDGDSRPKILPLVKTQIMNMVEAFKQFVEVTGVHVTGSILTKSYGNSSDIDVTIVTPTKEKEDDSGFWDFFKTMNGKCAGQSTHPINFYMVFAKTKKDMEKTFQAKDNIYDLVEDKWIKKTRDYTIDVNKYMDDFQDQIKSIDLETMEIRRNLIDMAALKRLPKSMAKQIKQKCETKIKYIERSIKNIIMEYDKIHERRQLAFQKPMSLAQIKKIKSKNTLPENVIYKLAEHYLYWDFVNKLQDIIKDDKVDKDDIVDIKDALSDLMTNKASNEENTKK